MMQRYTHRRVIGILGMFFSLIFLLLGVSLFFSQNVLPIIGYLIAVLAFLDVLMLGVVSFMSYMRFYYIQDDKASLLSGILSSIIVFFMLFGLQVFLSLDNNYMALPSFRLYMIAFIANLLLFVHSFLMFMSSRGKLIFDLYNKGNQTIKTNTKKTSRRLALVIPLILCVIIAGTAFLMFYPDLTGMTRLDIVEGIDVEFGGVNGEGYIDKVNHHVDYNGDNEKIVAFIEDMTMDYKDAAKLKNGDRIRINVIYSRQKAQSLKVYIGRSYKIVEVSGLPEAYDSDSEISRVLISQLKDDADERIKKVYQKQDDYESSFCSLWLGKDSKQSKQPNRAIAVAIHKVVIHTKEKDEDIDIIEYRATFHRDFDTSYGSEEEPYWYSHQLLKTSNDPVETEEDAIKAMKVKFSDYEFTQLE